MAFIAMIQPVLIMAVIVAIGYLLTKWVDLTSSTRHFISFTVMNVALPSIVINSIFQLDIDVTLWQQMGIIFVSAIGLIALALAAGYGAGRLFRYSPGDAKQIAVLSSFGNNGFIGIPMIAMLLGPTAGAFAAIFDAANMLMVFTLGIMLIQPDSNVLRQLKSVINMPFMTLAASLIIVSTGHTVPEFVFELSELLSSLAAPLAMIYIGMLIPEMTKDVRRNVRENFLSFVLIAAAVKVIVMPIFAFIWVGFFSIDMEIGRIILIQAAMPSFIMATVLFGRYAGREHIGMVGVLLSALISLFVLPMIIYITAIM